MLVRNCQLIRDCHPPHGTTLLKRLKAGQIASRRKNTPTPAKSTKPTGSITLPTEVGEEQLVVQLTNQSDAEDLVDEGHYNAACRVPADRYLAWLKFIHKFVVEFGKALVDKAHKAGKKPPFLG